MHKQSAQNVGAASVLPVVCPSLYWFGAAVCGPDPGWADVSFFLPAALWDWSRTWAAVEEEPGWDWARARARHLRALNSMLKKNGQKEDVRGSGNILLTPMWKRGAINPNICFRLLSHRQDLHPADIICHSSWKHDTLQMSWDQSENKRVWSGTFTRWIIAHQHMWKHPKIFPLTGTRAQTKVQKDMSMS